MKTIDQSVATAFRRSLLLLVSVALFGCATGPDYPPVLTKLKPELVGAAAAPAVGKQIVVVRYPYAFNDADSADLRRRYNKGAYYGVPQYDGGRDPDEQTFDSAVAKTSYYALRLQEALQTRLPDATVVLQPTFIQLKDGSISLVGDFQTVAPTVVVDFFAYVWPQWRPDIAQPFATVGNTVVPVASVRTLPQISSETNGAVAGMRFLTGLTNPGTGAGAYAGAGAGIVELLNCRAADAFVQVSPTLSDASHITARPWRPNKFLAWPTLKVNLDGDAVKASPNELSGTQAVDLLAYVVRDVLLAADANPAAKRELSALFVENYDADAATQIRAGAPLPAEHVRVLESFASAEQKFLQKQTDALSKRLGQGEWAASFKDSRAKEQSSLTKAKVVGWIGILAAGAIGNPGVTMAISQSMDSSYSQWASSMGTAMAEVRQEQLSVAFDEVGAEAEISASSLTELRTKLKAVYDRKTKVARTAN